MKIDKSVLKFKGVKLVTAFGIVVIAFALLFTGLERLGYFLRPAATGELKIVALNQDSIGVAEDSAFLLQSPSPLDEKTVLKTLQVEPGFQFTLEKSAGGREYTIIPQERLASNTIYKLSFDTTGMDKDNFQWAFQTKGKFRVIRTLPADKTTHVPVNTGIELTFSYEKFDNNKLQEYFKVSPQVAGRFEIRKKTVTFVPKSLQPATVYTVTVKKGFPLLGSGTGLDEDYSFSFETAPIEKKTTQFTFDLDAKLMEFSTKETPAYPVYFYSDRNNPVVNISLYCYPESKPFIEDLAGRDEIPSWSYSALNGYRQDMSKLFKYSEFQTEFLSVDPYNHYLIFPKPLPAGYYTAEIKAGEVIRQVWFQVSDLAVYQALNEQNCLFWANDLETGKPVPDIALWVESLQQSFFGNSSGIVLVDKNLRRNKKEYALLKAAGKELVVPLEAAEAGYQNNNSQSWLKARDYWKYIYLDRELYKPGDIVRFWGVLAPRAGDTRQIEEIELEVMGTEGPLYEGAEHAPIVTKKVAVAEKTFTGAIQLPVLKPGYYYVNVKLGAVNIISRGFSVETYQKPSYQLALASEKEAVFSGEKTGFSATATFFEGTPVPGQGLTYFIDGDKGTVYTDDNGTAVIPCSPQAGEDLFQPYRYLYLGVSATMPESGEITASGGVYLFRSSVYLTSEVRRQGNAFTLQTKLSNVDLDSINSGSDPTEENFVHSPAGNNLIKGSIYQNIWEKVEVGSRYNFISKQVEKIYSYKHSSKHINDFTMTTDDNGEAVYHGNLNNRNSYYAELVAQDSQGRKTGKRVTLSVGMYQDDQTMYYHLNGSQKAEGYAVGEDVDISFMGSENILAPREQGFLYFGGQKRIDTYLVSNSPQYRFTFKDDHSPNINIYGVYFDGSAYHETPSYLIPLDKKTKQLQVKIEIDKKVYRPQEKVKLTLYVTDCDNKPVNAQVNLNLVDEALYSLQDQQVNLLTELYNDYIFPLMVTRISHFHPGYIAGAESGGEGDGSRGDFRDTVLFTSLKTNSKGKAETEFFLPDNLTSWRVTYQAFTTDLQGGSGTCQIPVKQPFFVEMTMNDTALEGDQPTLILRAFGEKLRPNYLVTYTMKLVNPKGEEFLGAGVGKAFQPYDLVLPTLISGKYHLTIEGSSQEYRDSITRDFIVEKSFLEQTVTRFDLVKDDLRLKGSQEGTTTLIFNDYEKTQYLTGLYNLSCLYGSRVEQQIAKREARKLLNQYFPQDKFFFDPEDTSLQQYQKPDGGISILPYGESDLALSALIASYHADDFDQKALAAYFYRKIDDGENAEDETLALLGLAALDEPVLTAIYNRLQDVYLPSSEKIHLALACLEIGNGAFGRQVYREIMSKYGENMGTSLRMNIGLDHNEKLQATAKMALLAARLEQPEKNKLYQHLLDYQNTETLNSIEQVQILQYLLRYMDPDPVGFTYKLNNNKVSKTLKDREYFKLTLPMGEAENIRFSQIQGKVGVMSAYTKPYQIRDVLTQEGLNITRMYRVNQKKVNVLHRTDLIEVVLTYSVGEKAPAGDYEIVDILPAGLRYITRPYVYDPERKVKWVYPSEVKGQKITFAVEKGSGTISYYARVVTPGKFTVEPPLLSNTRNSGIHFLGTGNRIEIK